jgi:hypothetical protein
VGSFVPAVFPVREKKSSAVERDGFELSLFYFISGLLPSGAVIGSLRILQKARQGAPDGEEYRDPSLRSG